jgi:site-specific DNA-adenine methylase
MSLGIPYMGSKRKLASEILKLIVSRHSGITDFYDLFGGGGSVSFTAVKEHRFNVHYNELNKHIYSLVKYLKENKTLEPKFYEWVTREEFFNQIGKSNEDADWYSGFVMSCWSFRNNSEKGYMYGSEIMEDKRLAHEFLVNDCLESMKMLNIEIPEILKIKEIQKRRIVFCDYI